MDNLDQRDKTIIKLVIKYLTTKYKVEDFRIKRCALSDSLIVTVANPRIRFAILKNKVWKDIKTYVDRIFETISSLSDSLECGVCFEIRPPEKFLGCPECAQKYCYKCYASIISNSTGIIDCPCCNHEAGIHVPRGAIEMAVDDIMKQFES